ncbi:DUF4013 domain-containing protein [Methanobrevibacter sp.]|uniref:DUF4013 domain-containing protein n=1 Tax=Methanobrevibacter sp. TaxID=66852 RepID=UPI00388F30DF
MSLIDVFSESVTYPLNDIVKWIIVGIVGLLAGLSSTLSSSGQDSFIIILLAGIISIIFSIILSGYGIEVIKKGIQHSDEVPGFDIMANLINGIKVVIISIVYMIIPFIIGLIILGSSAIFGAAINQSFAVLSFATIIVLIIAILFGIFELVAVARFANSGDLGDALNVGEVFADAKRIGILKIILFLIIFIIIAMIAALIIGLFGIIPFVGVLIATILISGFITLFGYKALGLLYASG